MGMLNVVVLNPLVATSSVAQTISVAVFMCGSDDFSYEYIAQINPAFPVYRAAGTRLENMPANDAAEELVCSESYTPYRTIQMNTYEDGDDEEAYAESGVMSLQTVAPTNTAATVTDNAIGEDEGKDIQIAPPQVELQVDDHFGITGISLRNLAKKYQYICEYVVPTENILVPGWAAITINVGDCLQVPIIGSIPGTVTTAPIIPPMGLLSWMVGMYRQFKGGLRFKLVINTAAGANNFASPHIASIVTWLPGPLPSGITLTDVQQTTDNSLIATQNNKSLGLVATKFYYNNISTMRLATVVGNATNVLEFELPYASSYLSTLTYSGEKDPAGEIFRQLGQIQVALAVPTATGYTVSVYCAFADETRLGNLYRVPLVYVPGLFLIDSATAPMVPYANWGYGSYATSGTPPPLKGKKKVAQSRTSSFEIANAESGVLNQLDMSGILEKMTNGLGLGDTESEEFDAAPPSSVSTGGGIETGMSGISQNTGVAGDGQLEEHSLQSDLKPVMRLGIGRGTPPAEPSNPQRGNGRQRRTLPFHMWFGRKIRHFVMKNRGCRAEDIVAFINSIKPRGDTAVNVSNVGYLLKKSGVYMGRNNEFAIGNWTRAKPRRNRRPISGNSRPTKR
jgi:hypothetical protein